MSHRIIIIDDEVDIGQLVKATLEDEGFQVRVAQSVSQGAELIASWPPHLVLLDVWFERNQVDGLTFLDELRHTLPDLPVVMISGHGTIEVAVKAIQQGAYDFLQKPFDSARLLVSVRRAIETATLKRHHAELQSKTPWGTHQVEPLLGALKPQLNKIAPTGSRVFISGSIGSGKETVARYIHQHSKRQEHPFVVVDSALMSPHRFEMEFFGVEGEGSLKSHNMGLLEQAHGGTLFLAEITDMPYETQGKFARMLQDSGFMRVGSRRCVEVDVRVMAATHLNPQEAMASGHLREDLFYRLNVVPVHVPSLADRRSDIPELCDFFLKHLVQLHSMPPRSFSHKAMTALQSYAWPGNIRQLRNVIEWVVIMHGKNTPSEFELEHLPSEIHSSPLPSVTSSNIEIMTMKLPEARAVFEREYLVAQMNRFSGNISRTAEFIGMERSALHRKLKTLGAHMGKIPSSSS